MSAAEAATSKHNLPFPQLEEARGIMSESKGFSGLEVSRARGWVMGAAAGKETCASVSGVGPGAAWGLGRGFPGQDRTVHVPFHSWFL